METIAGNIAKKYEQKDGKANRRAIFKHYRSIDDSHLWPICGRFDATQRAIRQLYKYEQETGYYLTGLELCLMLDSLISNIVNSQN
jgi:hypothetical protein